MSADRIDAEQLTIAQLAAEIAAAKDRGARVVCGQPKCNRTATVLLACDNGTVQGVGCAECWQVHRDMIEAAMVFVASGMADNPICSRCGADPAPADHIITYPI